MALTPKNLAGWTLGTTLALVACNGPSVSGDAGMDAGVDAGMDAGVDAGLCTYSVQVAEHFLGQVETCLPDAGLPPNTETAIEIASCNQQIAGCDAQDLAILTTATNCFGFLPPLQCQWLMPADGGIPFALLAWLLEAVPCRPTGLSAGCALDGGFSFSLPFPFDGGFGL